MHDVRPGDIFPLSQGKAWQTPIVKCCKNAGGGELKKLKAREGGHDYAQPRTAQRMACWHSPTCILCFQSLHT